MDFSNQLLRKWGFEIPLHTPEKAARLLVTHSQECDRSFYECFLTDLVYHRVGFPVAFELLK